MASPKIYESNSSETPKRTPLRSIHEEIMVTGAVFSVVVTVTVTVTVAWPFPTAAFSFTGTPIGAYVMPALSALDVDVFVKVASADWGLSVLADGGVAEDCIAGAETSGEGLWGAVTTANNAFGIEIDGVASAAVVSGVDGVASDLGDSSKGLESWTCWTVVIPAGTEEVDATSWLWMVGCAEREEVTDCTGFCALTLCVAWLKSPSACNISVCCEATATGAAVEDAEPASILAASLGTMHCIMIPV